MRKFIKPLLLAMIPVMIVLASYSVFKNSAQKSDQNSSNENSTVNSSRGPSSSDGESINEERSRSFDNSSKKKSQPSLWNSLFGGSDSVEAEIANEPASGSIEKNQNSTNAKKTTTSSRFPISKPITPLTSSSVKSGSQNDNRSTTKMSSSSNSENRIDATELVPNGNELRRPDFTADNKNKNPVNDIINNIFAEGTTTNNTNVTGETAATASSSDDKTTPFITGNNSSGETNREPASTSTSSSSSSSSSSTSSTSSSNSYLVGGSVTGLNGTVVLQNNSGDDLTITQNGKYTFSQYILDQKSYAVTVKTQPTITPQICVVVNGTGTMSGSSVSNVNIHCTNSFTIGGTLSGLSSGSVILQNNSGNSLTLTSNGSFTFSTYIEDLTTYAVTIASQPSGQSCQLTDASGTVNNSNVTNVTVTCSTTATTTSFTVGGTITGLNGTVVLQNNNGDDLALFTNGSFTFVTSMSNAATYSVTVLTQPANHPTTPHQVCTVTNGSGTISSANITNISINCVTTSYTVSGTVTGLSGILVLQNNGGDDKTIVSNGAFTFSTSIDDLSTYTVSVLTNPTSPHQTCALASEAGTISDANITNVTVTCTTNSYTIGGTVAGLSGTVVLQNNSGNNKTITTDGAFSFTTSMADQATYSVSVLTLPTDQICSVTGNGSGTVNGANVTNVAINCVTPTLTFTNIASSYLTVNWSSLTAPQSTAASIEYKLYKNTGTVGSPTWTTIQNWTTSLSLAISSGIDPETIYYYKLETRDSTTNTATTTAAIKTPGLGYPAAVLLDISTATSYEADIAINGSNKSFAVWRENASGQDAVYVSQNSGTNRTWSTPYKLSTTSTLGSMPLIAADDLGNAIAIWRSNTATDFLYASRYDSAAATPTWSTPVNISNIEADADYDASVSSSEGNYKIAMDKLGNALAIWTQDVRISGAWRTHIVANYFDKSASSGAGAWLGHEVVDLGSNTGGSNAGSEPRVSFDSVGNAVAVWREYNGTNYHTISANFLIADKQWHPISQVDNEAGNTYVSDVLFKNDNNIYAIWTDSSANILKGGRYDLTNTGAGWTRETIGTSGYLTSSFSTTKVSANATGNVAVAYNENTSIAVNKYNISTDTWGTPGHFSGTIPTPVFINSSTGFDGSSSIFDNSLTYQPQVTIDNSNNLLTLWTERGHGSTAYAIKMFSARYDATAAAWEAPVLLEYAPKSGNAPYYISKLVTNPAGKSVVIYQTVDEDIYVRHLDKNIFATPYTLTYDANSPTSGTAPTDSTYYTTSAEALGNTGTLVKTGYAFTGWNTAADGSGTLYSATDEVNIDGNVTLYATWAPPPTVTTTAISNNVGGGNITTAANCALTAAGIVWSTSSNPTTADSKTTDGTAGVFTSTMTGLVANTTYYIRAYGTNCAGNTYGNEVTYTTGNYVVRETGPAGGLVFYDKGSVSDGWRYLEAAPSDYGSTIVWSEVNHLTANWDIILGGTGTAIGTGKANTTIITTSKGNGTYAAKIAEDLNTAGYNDWFVPAKDEVNALYTNLKAYGVGAFTTNSYWSSSEQASANVWSLSFNSGTPSASGQNNTYRLRSIRAFTGDLSQFSITFNDNGSTGGSVPTDGNSYYQGQAVTMPANTGTLVKAGYSFNGWKTVASGTATVYAPADLFTMPNANTTLYANWVTAPTVTTTNVDFANYNYSTYQILNQTTALAGGNITDDGGGITAHGICWSTSTNPTIADSKTNDGQGSGTFTSYLSGLTAGTRYYIRAYATNGFGTVYGQQETFVTAYSNSGGTGPAGGLVFIDNSPYASNWRFIEVAPVASENTSKDWGCDGTTVGTQTNYGTGQANTTAILTNGCVTTNNSANYCNDLVHGGFSDWYLPSVTDLNFIRNNLHANGLGNFTTAVGYSSSSEYSSSPASTMYYMTFNGGSGIGPKSSNRYVRCVRSFGNPNFFTVTYNGNGNTGGSAPTDGTNYEQGQAVTVATAGTLVKLSYTFAGWNTQANGSGTTYAASSTLTMSVANVTLYAIWEEDL